MSKKFRHGRLFMGLAVAISIGIILCVAFCLDLFHGTQLRNSDLLSRVTITNSSTDLRDNVVVVGIDDASLEKYGRLSLWSRSNYANLVDILAAAKARVIVFDILFADPAPGDEELAASMKDAGNVIMPFIKSSLEGNSTLLPDTADSSISTLRPLPILEQNAVTMGHANIVPDKDGIVRELTVVISEDDDIQPSLALAAVAKYLRRTQIIESPVNHNRLPFAGRLIPVNNYNEMTINFALSPGTNSDSFPIISFVEAIEGHISPDVFEDKIIIIGATASGLGDIFWTPLGQMMNGVEIHARAINTILTGSFLRTVSSVITIVLILLFALLAGIATLHLRVRWALPVVILFASAYIFATFFFLDQGIMLNTLYPPVSIAGAFVGVNIYNVTYERSRKNEITKTFGRYVSTSVVNKILPALEYGYLQLGGNEHEVTVAFADVRNFTGMSEEMSSGGLVRALNAHLSIIIEAVLKHGGIINKFGGDSVLAVWNAPTECDKHALLAIKASLAAQEDMKQLQERNPALPVMEFGIGINTGKAIAGNMGSEDRLEYSVIGDAVNIAARLADMSPGGKVWIGENTYQLAKNHIIAEPLEALVLRGKQIPVTAYELVDVIQQESMDDSHNLINVKGERLAQIGGM